MNDGADGCLVVSMAFMNNDMIDDCWWELSHDLRSKKKKLDVLSTLCHIFLVVTFWGTGQCRAKQIDMEFEIIRLFYDDYH